ncbi:hypothetical protein FUSO7_12525 [Fusobacterium necrophorum BFTR-2]|nr:hypothetical protein FUSO7_12525 [Fusobacterium necrophorum BFTR-2]
MIHAISIQEKIFKDVAKKYETNLIKISYIRDKF